MPCYSPMSGWRTKVKNPKTGRYGITFDTSSSYRDFPVSVPCGQCWGCRMERSRQWAIRCVHEAKMHDDNSYITLTYSPENLPDDLSVHLDHFQKFMKRLRKNYEKKYGKKKIRFYHCGEYGEPSKENNWIGRPHYHAILFGVGFPDRKYYKTVKGNLLYTSEFLDKCWKYGFGTIGAVTFESCAYVSRYITKKFFNKDQDEVDFHYMQFNRDTGEIYSEKVKPEYTSMSKKPGIGSSYYEKYGSEVYEHDTVIMRSLEMNPPKYYDRRFEEESPLKMMCIKEVRRKKKRYISKEKLAVEEKCARALVQRRKTRLLEER